jgi:sensor c-di-GMP phosphodiesterase-like protein
MESLTEAIISMARGLKLAIVAEGVETQKQLDYLQTNGVHLIQGWLFAQAMTYASLEQLLEAEQAK